MNTDTASTNTAKASRFRFLIGLVIVAAAVGVLVARGAKDAMVYYISPTELAAKGRGADVSGLRVKGNVVPGTIERNELTLEFKMTDGVTVVPVVYSGIVPDTFAENGEVVVEGTLASQGSFEADFLMAKCPSKYEAEMEEGDVPTAESTGV